MRGEPGGECGGGGGGAVFTAGAGSPATYWGVCREGG